MELSRSTRDYDAAVYLDTAEGVIEFLNAAVEDYDEALFRHVLGVVTRASGTRQLVENVAPAQQTINRLIAADEELPFGAVLGALKLLGLRVTVTPLLPAGND
jgi:probable addiction module antidote protein